MAKLFITEFSQIGVLSGRIANEVQAPRVPPDAEQTVAIGAASAQSAIFGSSTKFVQLMADVVCSVAFGTDPTATADTMRLAADVPQLFAVHSGDKVAVITNV